MRKLQAAVVVVMFTLAVVFCWVSCGRMGEFVAELKDVNGNLCQISKHLDRIAASLEHAQIMKPIPALPQAGR